MPMQPNQNPGDDGSTAMIPKTICPGMEFKPGDEIVLKVKSLRGDMLEVEYAPEHDQEHEMNDQEMQNPSEEVKSMPSDKMRNKLPKADREGY